MHESGDLHVKKVESPTSGPNTEAEQISLTGTSFQGIYTPLPIVFLLSDFSQILSEGCTCNERAMVFDQQRPHEEVEVKDLLRGEKRSKGERVALLSQKLSMLNISLIYHLNFPDSILTDGGRSPVRLKIRGTVSDVS